MLCITGLHDAIFERVDRFLAPGQHVLDLGCGRGALSLRLHDAQLSVDAVDFFDLCMCKKEVNFQKSTIEAYLSSHSGLYDAVFLVEVLEHLENPFQSLRAACQAIEAGGWLFISTPNVDSDYSRAWFFLKGRHWYFEDKNVNTDGHINPIHRFQLEYILEDLSMTIVDEFSIGTHPIGSWRFRALQTLLRAYQKQKSLPADDGVVRVLVAQKQSENRTKDLMETVVSPLGDGAADA
jgi:cyclopropane fatty-acyl-phospholipid synthase-like methyltransferase